jgi:hypothetical protein
VDDEDESDPGDPAGFRAAWDEIEHGWAATVARARTLDPALLHESVNGEWSFIETLRHLVFATECWVVRAMHGVAQPWGPLSLPWDEMPDVPWVTRDREVRPSLDEVLALRADRMALVRREIDGLTDEVLASETMPMADGMWPGPRPHRVQQCLWTVVNEERLHRSFAERDLDVLVARA